MSENGRLRHGEENRRRGARRRRVLKLPTLLSLDVIYHLVEDQVFDECMRTLVGASHRFMIIYASDSDDNREYQGPHVKHRQFSRWLWENAPEWRLLERIPNRYPYRGDYTEGSFAEFFIYARERVT